MQALPYSQLKPAWHLKSIEALRRDERPVPVHVQLVLSDLCNHDCSFCAYRMSSGLSSELFVTSETHNPNRRIETAKAEQIIRECAEIGVKAIQFTGGGEPTVHKDHEYLFTLAQDLGMQTALVTNGVKLKDTRAFWRMTWIRVSVDAGDRETYARVRRVSPTHWDVVWKNIETLLPRYAGVLSVGFVATNENWHGIYDAAAMARAVGVKNIRVGAVFSAEGLSYYKDSPEIAAQIARAKLEFDDERFEVIDMFSRRVGDLHDGAPTDPFCGYQHFTTYIGADLNVYRCCNTAYTKRGTIGNLAGRSFADVLASRPDFDARQCRYCQFLGQNRAISSLVREPTHAAFV